MSHFKTEEPSRAKRNLIKSYQYRRFRGFLTEDRKPICSTSPSKEHDLEEEYQTVERTLMVQKKIFCFFPTPRRRAANGGSMFELLLF